MEQQVPVAFGFTSAIRLIMAMADGGVVAVDRVMHLAPWSEGREGDPSKGAGGTHMTDRKIFRDNTVIGAKPAPSVTLRPARAIHRFALPKALPDVRGWKVVGPDDEEIGIVDALMVDTASVEVRWLAVGLNHSVRQDKGNRRISVLIPVGRVEHTPMQNTVALRSIPKEHLMLAPRIQPELPVTSDVEDATLALLGLATSHDLPIPDFYKDPAFDIRLGLPVEAADQ
jgi:hypothetical protein